MVALLCSVAGISVGYCVALVSSATKSRAAISAIPSAVAKMDDFSDHDVAVIIRMFRSSMAGKPAHLDKAVTKHLAKYYSQRSHLTDDEKAALGASALLPTIEELQNSSPELKVAIEDVAKAEIKK